MESSWRSYMLSCLEKTVPKLRDFSPPNVPQSKLKRSALRPTPPIYQVDEPDETRAMEAFIARHPFTIIKGACEAFEIDELHMTLFESENLVALAKNVKVETYVYTARPEVIYKRKEMSTIAKHAAYQRQYQPHQKVIKFGMLYMDQSGTDKLEPLNYQLQKLPDFLRPSSPYDMLSYAETKMGGINAFQLYMKVNGNRTGVHQEDLNMCSVNLNIGPASCIWYFVPQKFWSTLYEYALKHRADFFGRLWWPDVEELRKANIPVYVEEQKPGEIIYTNIGTPHWVESCGKTNNVAWNFALQTVKQYGSMMDRYFFNLSRNKTNTIPLKHMVWNMARKSKSLRLGFHACLLDDLAEWLAEILRINAEVESKMPLVRYERAANEGYQHCEMCHVELFNFIFVRKGMNRNTRCWNCVDRAGLFRWECLYEYEICELIDIYAAFTAKYDVLLIGSEALTAKSSFSLPF